MQFPVIESPLGDRYYLNGELIDPADARAVELTKPCDDVKYYETVRIKDNVLLFIEDHLKRLSLSVKGIEDFPVDTEHIMNEAYSFIRNVSGGSEGNLRIVLTSDKLVMHICEANIPSPELFRTGISANVLNWERKDPNLKVFRGDYKAAVAECFKKSGLHGLPYELILSDNEGKLYEGSKSNFFAIIDGRVYSAPDDKILIGITRNRVMSSLERAGAPLETGMFTLDELVSRNAALFVSSTPFDILPVTYVEDREFDSVNNDLLNRIMNEYRKCTEEYINRNT
ncbi:MAG: aminotransferase class IV [Clostridiales bacterium]|nr:aminotransferase class IV [Clostridiales bacterium]